MSEDTRSERTRSPSPQPPKVQNHDQIGNSSRIATESEEVGGSDGVPVSEKTLTWLASLGASADRTPTSKVRSSGSSKGRSSSTSSQRTTSRDQESGHSNVLFNWKDAKAPEGYFMSWNGQLIPKPNTVRPRMPQETDKERLIAACWAGAVHTPWYGKREFDYSEDKTDVDPTTQAGGSAWDRGYARQGFVDESLQRHTRRHLKKAADIERWVEGELDKWRAENEAAIRDIWIPMAKKVNEENGGSDWCEDFEELRTASRGRKEKPSARDDIDRIYVRHRTSHAAKRL
ncbi:hypothetical protein ONZ45_g7443 [Pleurotus djamor]|nr:hypothetical protein ONZ45_g7443 [Pleurotus djamor]